MDWVSFYLEKLERIFQRGLGSEVNWSIPKKNIKNKWGYGFVEDLHNDITVGYVLCLKDRYGEKELQDHKNNATRDMLLK